MTTLDQSIKDYEAFVARSASPEVVARIAAKLRDPNSDLRQWFRKCAEIRRERRRRNDLLPLPPLDDSEHQPSPPAEPLAVPSSVVADQARPDRRGTTGRRWRAVTLAALALLAVVGTASGTYAGVLYVQKRSRSSEVLTLVASAREFVKAQKREEALRVFGQAENLTNNSVSDQARAALASLRAEMGVLKSLSDLYVTSNREWLDHAGVKKASDAYLEFFTEAGILGGGQDAQQQAAAIRSRPEAASYLIAGIDHWLSVLYLLPTPKNAAEQAERRQLDALVKKLQQTASAADDGKPSKQLRQLVADDKLDDLVKFFDANKSQGLHPETVGQLTGFLISRGRADAAYFLANDAWWNYPNNATIAGVLLGLSKLPADQVLYATLQTASDPENGVFWFNLAAAHAANNNQAASEFAKEKANTLNPSLRNKP